MSASATTTFTPPTILERLTGLQTMIANAHAPIKGELTVITDLLYEVTCGMSSDPVNRALRSLEEALEETQNAIADAVEAEASQPTEAL